MGAKADTENTLRELQVLISRAPAYSNSPVQCVINRSETLMLLARLNKCMEQMLEEYELIQSVRDRNDRALRREAEERMTDAQRKAEDVYAAAVLFTDQALEALREQTDDMIRGFAETFHESREAFLAKQEEYRANQAVLREQLQDMLDSRKYQLLIEEENRRTAHTPESAEGLDETPQGFAAGAFLEDPDRPKTDGPEIIVNPEYFRKRAALLAAEGGEEAEPVEEDADADLPELPEAEGEELF